MPWNNITTYVSGQKVMAPVWEDVVENMNFLEEVAYTQYISAVTMTGTTVGAATQIVSAGAITYEAVPHLIEFYCPIMTAGAGGQLFIILRDGTTVLGTLARVTVGASTPLFGRHRLTPTAASHTYNIAGWNAAAGTSTANGGSGGAAGNGTTDLPGFIRITRVPT